MRYLTVLALIAGCAGASTTDDDTASTTDDDTGIVDPCGGELETLEGDLSVIEPSDLDGQECLGAITGDLDFIVTDVTDVDSLSRLHTVGGNVIFSRNDLLTDVGGLAELSSVGGFIQFAWNPGVTDLDAFAGLTEIGGYLSLSNNEGLVRVSGLGGVTSVGGNILVSNHTALSDISGLTQITSAGGDVEVFSNPSLCQTDVTAWFATVSATSTYQGGNDVGC